MVIIFQVKELNKLSSETTDNDDIKMQTENFEQKYEEAVIELKKEKERNKQLESEINEINKFERCVTIPKNNNFFTGNKKEV